MRWRVFHYCGYERNPWSTICRSGGQVRRGSGPREPVRDISTNTSQFVIDSIRNDRYANQHDRYHAEEQAFLITMNLMICTRLNFLQAKNRINVVFFRAQNDLFVIDDVINNMKKKMPHRRHLKSVIIFITTSKPWGLVIRTRDAKENLRLLCWNGVRLFNWY